MVVLASRRRVVHFAVWGSAARGRPGALCRNRGDLPVYGRLDEFPGVPVCTRCKSEVELLTSAIRSVES